MAQGLSEEKRALRQQMLARRKQLCDGSERSRQIAHRVLASAVWKQSRAVALYMALPGEVETDFLRTQALLAHKRVYMPRVEDKRIVFYPITSESQYERSSLGIAEPLPQGEGIAGPASGAGFALCLVPGLAFDRTGTRLGFGGGMYDRFFGAFGEPLPFVRMGICFSCQLLPLLPREAWDRGVDMLCTEDEFVCI